jgi:thiamine biosynthesis protein ThiI
MSENIEKVILIRCGEIILKGLNRSVFEAKLIANIKKSLYGIGKINIVKSQSRIYVEPLDNKSYDFEKATDKLTKIFGIVSVSTVFKIKTDYTEIIVCRLRSETAVLPHVFFYVPSASPA